MLLLPLLLWQLLLVAVVGVGVVQQRRQLRVRRARRAVTRLALLRRPLELA